MAYYDFNGIIDMHIHSSPDIRERSHHDIELAYQAKKMGAEAFVLKSHYFPTTDRAWFLNQLFSDLQVFGSITLNPAVGGINPSAVESALLLGAKVVWMPTLFSTNHRRKDGKSGGVASVLDHKPVPELIPVLKLIAENNAVLGTGHLSAEEIFIVVEEARKQGVNKIVITHPEFHIVNVTLKQQKDLVESYDVYFERTYAQPIGNGRYQSNLEVNVDAIKTLGPTSTIVSTDSGQIQNPAWNQALKHYIHYLEQSNIPIDAISTMTKSNPAALLDLNNG